MLLWLGGSDLAVVPVVSLGDSTKLLLFFRRRIVAVVGWFF